MNSKKERRIVATILSLLAVAVLAFTACGKKPEENVTVTLSDKEITLAVGESKELTVSIEPADAMDKSVVWKSDDTKIATVEDGVVQGVAEGETVVTVTSGKKSDSCKVIVKNAEEPSSPARENAAR